MSVRDIEESVARWRRENEPVALATVVRTWGSGPRGPGAKMAMTRDARIAGSVSGGCVESAVVEEARRVLSSGESKLLRFGVADETAWEVGLSCGGTIQVLVEPLSDELFAAYEDARRQRRALARAIPFSGDTPGPAVTLIEGRDPDGHLEHAMAAALERGVSEWVTLEDGDEAFVDVELPDPTLVMVGGVHVAITLTSMADALGFKTVVVDPRGVFGSDERFAHASEIVREWPDDALRTIGLNRSSAVATLSHDPKLDDPALEVALPSAAFYVGALGSRRTHEKRVGRLTERGVSAEALGRIHAPIGAPIGSRTPAEIAVSILAQIIATRNGVSL